MRVTCPKCSTKVEIDPSERDDSGRVRLACADCGAKLLIKVKAQKLKLDDNIPEEGAADADTPARPSRTGGSLDLGALEVSTGVDDTSDEADASDASWVVVVEALGDARITAIRTTLMRVPRFSRNPNKLHDLTDELPFVLGGIGEADAKQLEGTLAALGTTCRVGPESKLLDASGRPVTEPEEGLVVAGEEDDESGELVVAGADDDEPQPEEGLVVMGDADSMEVSAAADGDEADEGLVVAGDEDDDDHDDDDGGDDGGDADGEDEDAAATAALEVAGAEEDDDEDDDDVEALGEDDVEEAATADVLPAVDAEPEPEGQTLSADDLSGVDLSLSEGFGEVGYTTPPDDDEPIEMGDLMSEAPAEADTVRSGDKGSDTSTNGVLLATVDAFPGLDDIIGLVSASVVVPASDLKGRARAVKLEAAIASAEDGLKRDAAQQGAAAVVGVRTTSATLPDGSVLLVMQGTATA